MRKIINYFVTCAAILICFCGCTKNEDVYYVRYEAVALTGTDTGIFHDVILTNLPFDKKSHLFHCEGSFCREYGPYSSGEKVTMIVDSPHLDTFMARIYIRKKKGEYQLAAEAFNQVGFSIP